ncbi:MAG: hypothetical protein DWQ45_19585 [Planctomycetota bacterium]|nr:MAG: hypothetical protein DWQ41_02175 [Planctomycetota bacterium]REK31528.1 MAG: hypothetical protein DWQ45_19585 [Planctomycetota bacterium]
MLIAPALDFDLHRSQPPDLDHPAKPEGNVDDPDGRVVGRQTLRCTGKRERASNQQRCAMRPVTVWAVQKAESPRPEVQNPCAAGRGRHKHSILMQTKASMKPAVSNAG